MQKESLMKKREELEKMIDTSSMPDDAWNEYIFKSIFEIEKEMEALE